MLCKVVLNFELFLDFTLRKFFNNSLFDSFFTSQSVGTVMQNYSKHIPGKKSSTSYSYNNFQKLPRKFDATKGHSGAVRDWKHSVLGQNLKRRCNYGHHQGIVFKIMSYNCLSQQLMENHPHLYRNSDPNCLNWDSRSKILLDEIAHHSADILCLQEVQETHWSTFYMKQLERLGYRGLFKKRTGEFPDGCAIFYKQQYFEVIEHQSVEFHMAGCAFTNRNNVAIVARLAPKAHLKHSFIVANTHLLYNPAREDVRLAQMQLLLTEIDRLAYVKQGLSFEYLPFILCGDFNSEVNSNITAFLLKRFMPYASYLMPAGDKTSWLPQSFGVTDECQYLALIKARFSGNELSRDKKNVEDNALFHTGVLKHRFKLNSAYPFNSQEVSTKQDDWKMVDYIYYSKLDSKCSRNLIFLARYLLPTAREVAAANIPNRAVGSDHFSLLALFKFEF